MCQKKTNYLSSQLCKKIPFLPNMEKKIHPPPKYTKKKPNRAMIKLTFNPGMVVSCMDSFTVSPNLRIFKSRHDRS